MPANTNMQPTMIPMVGIDAESNCSTTSAATIQRIRDQPEPPETGDVAGELAWLRRVVQAAGHRLEGYLVQRMAPAGTELIIGVVGDPAFGPVVAVGAGRTRAELIRDVQVWLAPLGRREAADAAGLRAFALLAGFRGRPRAELAAGEDVLLRTAALAAAHPEIAELDCNPVIAGPAGTLVVDARVRIAPPAASGAPGRRRRRMRQARIFGTPACRARRVGARVEDRARQKWPECSPLVLSPPHARAWRGRSPATLARPLPEGNPSIDCLGPPSASAEQRPLDEVRHRPHGCSSSSARCVSSIASGAGSLDVTEPRLHGAISARRRAQARRGKRRGDQVEEARRVVVVPDHATAGPGGARAAGRAPCPIASRSVGSPQESCSARRMGAGPRRSSVVGVPGPRVLAPVLAALALALPASALAAWGPAVQIPGQPGRGLGVGLDGRGDGVLAWSEYPVDGGGVMRLARRSPGAAFGAPQTVSPLGQDVRAFSLASTPAGGAALAWRAGREPDGQILVMSWRLGGEPGTARPLRGVGVLPRASRAGLGALERPRPAIAIGRRGWALAAWLARGPGGCGYVVRAAVRAPGRGFGAGVRVSAGCAHAARPQVAITERGWGVVTWRQGARLYDAVMTGRRLGPARPLSPEPVGADDAAVVASADRVVIAWHAAGPGPPGAARGRVLAVEIRDGRPGRTQAVSRGDRILGPPRLAAAGSDAVAAAWQNSSSVLAPVQFALSPAAGRAFSAPEIVARHGVADARVEALRVALDRAGGALVTWCGQVLGSAVRPSFGVFLGRERIFAPATGLTLDDPCAGGRDEVRLAVAQDTGEALLAWTRRPRLLAARRPGPLR
jgi:ATP-grasp domain